MEVLLMFILPLLAMLVMQFSGNDKNASMVALVLSLLPLADTVYKLMQFDPLGGKQFVVDYPWVENLGISFSTAVDGISMLMILLTNALVPLIILSGFGREIKNPKNFYSLVFLMQFALLGVFTSMDGFLFYIFWELALIPIWFICLMWGGYDRTRITLKFFIYTLSGSLLMLVGMIYLYLQTPGTHTFDINSFYALSLTSDAQSWLFWAFFIAFAIKIPVFPFHTWQPDTYVTAPTQGTMLLSGIMLKMGLYGIIRFMIPVIPHGFESNAPVAMILAVAGVIYGSAMAIAQKDFKRLMAYSSMAHVGLIAAGILTVNAFAIKGGVYQMLSHGVNAVGLFFVADILIHRFGNSGMSEMGGIAHKSKKFAVGFMIIMLGSIALPLTNGFVGEFLLLSGIYSWNVWAAAFAGLTVIFGAVYMLRAYQKIMLGDETGASSTFGELQAHELILLTIVGALVIIMGVYPTPLMDIAGPSIDEIIKQSGILS